LYAYRKSFLSVYPTLPESQFEEEELEQLRVLYSGYRIKVVPVDKASPGVDVPQDIEKVIQEIKNQSIGIQ
jgi:3-deoxy-manno-octulosonate cytidylyltransferase (CMP-KDO synthetase)